MKSVFGLISLVAGVISLIYCILRFAFLLERVWQALPGVSRQFRDLIVDAFSQPPPASDPAAPPPTETIPIAE